MTSRHSVFALLIAAAFVVGTACSSTPEPAPDSEPEESATPRPDPDFSQVPEDFSSAEVMGVVAAPQGSAVILGSLDHESVLPIFINPSQAMAIQLGLDGQTFERPLTHDLVADIMSQVGTAVGKVHVDDLREGTFIATIYLVTPVEVLEIDARPSDAIALAVKDGIPIYVADKVLDEAGLTDEDLEQLPPADPGDPDDFHDAPTTPL